MQPEPPTTDAHFSLTEPASLRGLSTWFLVLCIYGIAFGVLLSVVGLFSGWHVVGGGILHLVIGMLSAYVSAGLPCRWKGAWLTGLIVMLAITTLAAWVMVSSSGSEAFVAGLLVTLFGTVTAVHCTADIRDWCQHR